MKVSKQKIKEAVLANRGGLANATDAEINIIWRSLPEATQKLYLETLKGKDKNDAPGT